MMVLKMKVTQLERKNRALRHRSMIHRVMQVQVQDNLLSLKMSNEDLTRQLQAAEAARVHEQEGEAILRERLVEAEYRLDELGASMHAPPPTTGLNASVIADKALQPPHPLRRANSCASFSFVRSRRSQSLGGGMRAAGEEEGNWREAALERAEVQLRAAMGMNDGPAIRLALGKAAKACELVKGATVVCKKQMLRGKSKASLVPLDVASIAAAEAEAATKPEIEAQWYLRFHKIAAARKLALSSCNFEIVDARIEDLFNLAQKGEVPCAQWHAFLRKQLPSPRGEGGADWEEDPNAPLPQQNQQVVSAFVDGLKLLKDTGSSAGSEGRLIGAPFAKVRRYRMHGELFDDLYAASSVKQVRMRRSSIFDKDYAEVAGEVAGGIRLPDESATATQQGANVPPVMQPEMQMGSMDLEMLRLQRPTWMSEEQAASYAYQPLTTNYSLLTTYYLHGLSLTTYCLLLPEE